MYTGTCNVGVYGLCILSDKGVCKNSDDIESN